MPCVTNDDPLESYFFGRKGDPKKGFEWTYNFFFNGASAIGVNLKTWARVKTNKKLGVMWANDDDGRVFEHVMPPVINGAGFTIIDPSRFDLPVSDCTPEIMKFKSEGAEIVFPRSEFHGFLEPMRPARLQAESRDRRQSQRVPAGHVSVRRPRHQHGDRGLVVALSSLFVEPDQTKLGRTRRRLRKGHQPAGVDGTRLPPFVLEVPIAALKMTQKLDDPASIRDAVRDNAFQTIVGSVDFKKGPFPNTALTQLVAGQWRKSKDKRWPLELVIVDNQLAPNIPVGGEPEPMPGS